MKDNIYTKNERDKISPNTYISKEQFIEMLSNLNFIAIEECDIQFITAFLLNCEKDTISPKGFKITII